MRVGSGYFRYFPFGIMPFGLRLRPLGLVSFTAEYFAARGFIVCVGIWSSRFVACSSKHLSYGCITVARLHRATRRDHGDHVCNTLGRESVATWSCSLGRILVCRWLRTLGVFFVAQELCANWRSFVCLWLGKARVSVLAVSTRGLVSGRVVGTAKFGAHGLGLVLIDLLASRLFGVTQEHGADGLLFVSAWRTSLELVAIGVLSGAPRVLDVAERVRPAWSFLVGAVRRQHGGVSVSSQLLPDGLNTICVWYVSTWFVSLDLGFRPLRIFTVIAKLRSPRVQVVCVRRHAPWVLFVGKTVCAIGRVTFNLRRHSSWVSAFRTWLYSFWCVFVNKELCALWCVSFCYGFCPFGLFTLYQVIWHGNNPDDGPEQGYQIRRRHHLPQVGGVGDGLHIC